MEDFEDAVSYPLLRRRRDEDRGAIENLEEDGDEVVQEGAVLLALTITLDIVSYLRCQRSLCSQICAQSVPALEYPAPESHTRVRIV